LFIRRRDFGRRRDKLSDSRRFFIDIGDVFEDLNSFLEFFLSIKITKEEDK